MSIFKSSPTKENVGFDIILGQDSNLNGDIESKGSVRIDGHLSGNINASGAVIIGEDATVKGDITADQIDIWGKVDGYMNASGQIKLYHSSILKGDITANSFYVDEGAVFEGLCKIANIEKNSSKVNATTTTSK